MKNFLLALSTLLYTFTLYAEDKLAIIKDADGYTNVRSGPGKEFVVVDTLYMDDFFYFTLNGSAEWLKVSAWKGSQIEGFVHKSRIQVVEDLSSKKQKEIITKVLNRQKILADIFRTAWENKDSLTYKNSRRELELYSDMKYSPVLDVLPSYFCATKDITVLQLFIVTMWADNGSANEMPAIAIGDCFTCKPDLVIDQLRLIKNVEQKELLLDLIEFGLSDKDFKRLKATLDAERKK